MATKVKAKEPASISWRPTLIGRQYAVACGHYLASAAAARVLAAGGNAVDAGVTMAMALSVLQPDVVSFGGVAPTLIYLKSEGRVVSLAGLGPFPKRTDVARIREAGGEVVPEGIFRQVVPAAPATHVEALRRFGTISFEEAATPAYELAKHGFAMYPELRDSLEIHAADIDRYAENASIFRPGGKTAALDTLLKQENLAATIGLMIQAERNASGSRDKKLQAVHDVFYKGKIAQEIERFHIAEGGFMRADDLAAFKVPIEQPIAVDYQGYKVHTCDVWCQGIVLLQTLKLLERADLKALGHNSTAYLHLIAEALNLAFADREAYVGDPRYVDVPTQALLSGDYAARQHGRIDMRAAFGKMPEPGEIAGRARPTAASLLVGASNMEPAPDTIHGSLVDAQGNAYSITPSDTMYDSPMVAGLGLTVSTRGMQGRLQESHPCFIQPGKRPRLTPTPTMALRDGDFSMAWGTPGGDVQCASILQVFLNITQFGMTVQQAIEAPRAAPFNFPNSFSPHKYFPGRLCVEGRIAGETIEALRTLGHDVEVWADKSWSAGAVCAVRRDPDTKLLHAGADPRRAAYAAVW